jgi:hypothetical protein
MRKASAYYFPKTMKYVEASCEHGNEYSGSIKRKKILDWVRNWRLLKQCLAPSN